MKQISIAIIILFLFNSCKKNEDDTTNTTFSFTELEGQVLTGFANDLVNPNYNDLESKTNALYLAVLNLNDSTINTKLIIAQNQWRIARASWEQSEAFIFGPVEDFNYDPIMDTWPVNRVDMDSLLASSNPLSPTDIDVLPYSLKGYHPIEYMLFGNGGSKIAADFTQRELQYLVTLTQSLLNTTVALRKSWDVNQQNFTKELVQAGNGSTRYATRLDAFTTIVNAMAGICDEVANGKMEEPFFAQDSTLEESQFSHNSTADFKNNITGVLNAYLSKYKTEGHGLNELVASKNISLDNKLQSQINTAIASFDNIDSNYGAAIYTQPVQIINAQNAINTLRVTIEAELLNFIITNVKD